MTRDVDLFHLFNTWGTDKIYHAHTYEILLDEKRLRIEHVLEIGIGTMIPGVHSSMVGYGGVDYRPGNSLRAWKDYFPKANVIGLDVQPDTQFAGEDRIQTYLCDSTSATDVERTMETIGVKEFDLIIDDGSHLGPDQLTTLANFFPYLKPAGLYVVEDVMPGSLLYEEVRTIQSVIGENPYFSVPIASEAERWQLIVIKKRADIPAGEVQPGERRQS
jgi:hypothetical protein